MAEEENEVRWDGLCSRDSTTRETALENIRQIILRKTEYLRSVKETPYPSDGFSNAVCLDGLNKLLAHLLMLSKRCPFKDVREKSEFILKSVQVRKSIIITINTMKCYLHLYSLCISNRLLCELIINDEFNLHLKFRVFCKTLNLGSRLSMMN